MRDETTSTSLDWIWSKILTLKTKSPAFLKKVGAMKTQAAFFWTKQPKKWNTTRAPTSVF